MEDLTTRVAELEKMVKRLTDRLFCFICEGVGEVDYICGNCEGDGCEYRPCKYPISCKGCQGTGRKLR